MPPIKPASLKGRVLAGLAWFVDPRSRAALRWVVALGIGFWGVNTLRPVGLEDIFGQSWGRCMTAFGSLAGACVLVAPEAARWAAYPLLRLVDSIFLPADT